MAGKPVMTALHDTVADYLTIRRALGYKLVEHERQLNDFASFLEHTGASTITTELALRWASRTRGTEGWKAARLSIVRGLARYLRTIDPATEIPPTGILIHRKHYAIPYLYSEQDIERLLAEAAALRPQLKAATLYTLIGLIAVTGMRISEPLRLDRDDVDLDAGVLTIRLTKFGKSRQLPLHASTVQALARYDQQRDELFPRPHTPSFFISTRGNRPDKSTVQRDFRGLRRRVGLEGTWGSPKPRVHDLRHSFAVRTVIDWHHAGIDVQPRLLWLSTYLGHVEPSDTYRYLTAAPELLALAAKRLETTLGDLP
ncbi:MAG: tyrosine-type recombinase/integrase [Solirubrobacteraceae bacterium]